tara:strand:- start:1478 stop:2917 length:1440 start_codon:yes stop_codon:yes gene_type:complete
MFKILKFQENNLLIYSIIFLIVLLGFVFRFYNINYENLWLDEIYSFWVADPNLSFAETYLRVQTTESIPFLYYYLIKMCNKIFGYDPIVGRCFSAFFGFFSIFSVGILCKKISQNKSYLLTSCLISLNIFLIVNSQEMRVYILTFFLSSLSLIYFLNLYKENKNRIFTKNFLLFTIFTFLAIVSHPFVIIILISIMVFIIIDYFFFFKKNHKVNISLMFISILTIGFLYHYINYISLDKVGWIEQPGIKFFTNLYFSKFFGSRLLGIIHLLILIILLFYFKNKIKKNKEIIFLFVLMFLSYFIPLVYGYLIKPIIFPKYIIFVLIPIILIISILVFFIKNKTIKGLVISFLILINFANHFTESTLKQFFSEKQRFNPNFEKAFTIIDESQIRKLNFYTNKINDENQNYINTVIANYSKIILNKKDYSIEILKDGAKNTKGKIWNICLVIISCDKPPSKSSILEENLLEGGLKLSLWEIK